MQYLDAVWWEFTYEELAFIHSNMEIMTNIPYSNDTYSLPQYAIL